MSRSLHARLLWAALLPLGLLLGAGAWWLQSAFVAAVERGFDQRLAASLEALVASVEPAADGSLGLRRTLAESGYAQVRSGWYWQVDDASGVLRRSRSLWDAELAPPPGAGPQPVDLSGPAGEPLRVLAREIRYAARAAPLRFVVSAPRSAIDGEIATFRRLLLAGVAGVLALSALALALQVRLGLRPLRRLRAQLEQVEAGARADLELPPATELAALAHKINSVLEHNQRMAARGRKLAGDLAHALKTPLALLGSDPALATSPEARRALDRLEEIVQRHLAQASAQARREQAHSEIAPLAEALAAMFRKLHAPRGVALEIEIDVPAGMRARCESEDLSEMLGNLVDNACRAARSHVRLRARAQANELCIDIDDDGPGLDEPALAQLGVRGQRLDEQSGAGLGVSISRDIAESYGGTLGFARSEWGGLCASLRLPGGT